MKKTTKYFLSFFLILAFTSCGGGSTQSNVEETIIQPEILEKIEFDVSVTETVKMVSALTSDSPNIPIEIANYTFSASVTNIESGLIIRLTVLNEQASSYKEILSGPNEGNVLTYTQSRTRPINIKVKVYQENNKDNFTEKEFSFNGSFWVEQ